MQVGGGGEDIEALGDQSGGRLMDAVAVEVAHGHRGAHLGELADGGQAEAAGPAGDQ